MTIIGIFGILGLIFIKGFIVGFYLAAFCLTFSFKGIILSLIYILFVQGINIISLFVISVYGIRISRMLFSFAFNKSILNSKKRMFNYLIIFIILLFISIISSLMETFVFPTIIKLIIKLFVFVSKVSSKLNL